MALEFPGALVPCVRETVLLQYRAALEALQHAFGARGEPAAPLAEVRRARERLGQLGAVLDRLGWPGDPVPRACVLVAAPELLSDALYGSLIDAGERLAVACEGSWRGEASADSVGAAAAEVIGLDRLLRELEGRR